MLHLPCTFRAFFLSAAAVVTFAAIPNAVADSLSVSFYAAGVQTSPVSTFVETFDNAAVSGGTLTSTFNGSGLTGTYSGNFSLANADVFGGAGGSGKYITTNTSYSLALSSGVNYLGLWFSALDSGNQIAFYNGSSLLYTFTPSAFTALVGACPSSGASAGFCGNPNAQQAGNATQQYAFLNFYDPSGTFNKVVFTENPQVGGFESDNHTVANLTSAPGGNLLSMVPEPSTLLLLGTGLAGSAGVLRRRLA